MSLLSAIIRFKFACTTRERATVILQREMESTLATVDEVGLKRAEKGCVVPAMPGVDPEMRGWSLWQILEHNTIVNTQMAKVVESLCRGELLETGFDPKHDVLPSDHPGPEVVADFRQSVEQYVRLLPELPNLRQTRVQRHPVFGFLNAHGWHCMMGFHLTLHRRQAERVGSLLLKS